ncbi:MAG: hypothetical protein L3J01_05335 [Thiomicrorhabdus sp.]|nr:hypothetical protein [Thiomicrorhabdus sp.]
MLIGRRHFLKFIGSAIAGAHIDSFPNAFSSTTHFIDQKLGFGFKIPTGWYLEAFREDFSDLLGGQQLAERFRDDEHALEELSQGLMATLSKYPIVGDTRKRFSPSITFFKDADSSLCDYSNLLDLTSDAISGFSSVLTDFECTAPPKFIERSDCIMTSCKSKFLFEHEDLVSVMIDDEVFVIHHKGSIYTIHLYDSPYSGDTSQNEFALFRNSLHIA